MKRKIFAFITAQKSCKRIIDVAKEQARTLSAELEIVTVQPLKAEAKRRSKDMICLTELSKQTGCEIRIIYSDNPFKAILTEIDSANPYHIFVGQGSKNSSFLTKLRMAALSSPISVVGTDGIIYSLPPILEDILALG